MESQIADRQLSPSRHRMTATVVGTRIGKGCALDLSSELNRNMTAQRFNLTLHHVQTDATTRNLGNRLCGSKTRMEDQLQDFFFINELDRL